MATSSTSVSTSEAATTFELWRQDDNGNRFLVATYGNRDAAERRLSALTRSLHKQTYWIAASPVPSGRGEPS